MAYDETAAARVRTALTGKRGLVEQKMMGGLVFLVDGNMCCGVSGAALLVRVGKEGYVAALKRAHVRPLEFGGRRPSGFVLVDPPGWKGAAALGRWIAQGLAVARVLPKKG
jgi:hypothetical protein